MGERPEGEAGPEERDGLQRLAGLPGRARVVSRVFVSSGAARRGAMREGGRERRCGGEAGGPLCARAVAAPKRGMSLSAIHPDTYEKVACGHGGHGESTQSVRAGRGGGVRRGG